MTRKSQSPEINLYKTLFSDSRIGSYLNHTSGNPLLATMLYDWNTQVSSALWELISYLEVALRNAIDFQLKDLSEQHWLLRLETSTEQRTKQSRVEILQAKKRLQQSSKRATPEQIISELPFGFWASLISQRYRDLWPDLAGGFKGMPTRNPEKLQELLKSTRELRNRIGHHHRIWALDLNHRLNDLYLLGSYLDPELEALLKTKSRVERILDERPQ
jgi:abortive infection bacteriophage resistance protein